MEARDEKRLAFGCRKQLLSYRLLIIDELGFVAAIQDRRPSCFFEVFSQRYERGSSCSRAICPSTSGRRSSAPSA